MKTKSGTLTLFAGACALFAATLPGQAGQWQTRELPCDGPGRDQVCVGNRVQVVSDGCRYTVSRINAVLADGCFWPRPCDGGKTILTYTYDAVPVEGANCAAGPRSDLQREAFDLMAPDVLQYGEFKVGDDVEFRGDCHGKITAFEEGGAAWIAAAAGSPCEQAAPWKVASGGYALPSKGRLPPDLFP